MSLDWLRKRFSFKSGVTAREGLPAPPKAELEPVRSPREVAYRRPRFLAAVAWKGEGTEVDSRPIYSSPQDHPLLWSSGYAEVINSCKSQFNEDQAVCCHISAKRKESCQWEEAKLLVSPDGDEMICQEMLTTKQSGGCTALTALYLHGKFYLANAGDSRAIIIQKQSIMQLSSEFTPEMERQRLQYLAFIHPEFLADEFTRFEFPRRLKREDLGQKVLYRDYCMAGWGYKIVKEDDLKYPLVHGRGKQARLLGTLAVSRGLGDHQLKVAETNIAVKPFLSCIPEVKVLDFANHEFLKDDVLVMATDGLWDVLSNEEVAQVVRCFLDENKLNPCRFLDLAKHLVCKARGTKTGNQWTLDSNTPASYDDISVFVIPLWCQNSLPEP
ncbi:protein phosphatase 1M isoform X3 [Rhinatrema bivittatum]|uniref:protein phosphatase 1M isoform X3 n=1 Tax=Rhinatrema bivittatum TaxID=194408 RepID=UPI001126108B|nr:protein phosphatase 1M isoform X3 [Rhinatrema bivittatum]